MNRMHVIPRLIFDPRGSISTERLLKQVIVLLEQAEFKEQREEEQVEICVQGLRLMLEMLAF